MSAPKYTVRQTTLDGLRSDYRRIWSAAWPYNDTYLSELWLETKGVMLNAKGNQREPWTAVRSYCLTLMRECHPMEGR